MSLLTVTGGSCLTGGKYTKHSGGGGGSNGLGRPETWWSLVVI